MSIIMVKPPENAVVTRHNNLIEARYHLTVQEKRLVLWILTLISPDDTDVNTIFRVGIKDFAEYVGVDRNKNIYAQMTKVTERLLSRKAFDVGSIESGRLLQVKWISSADYNLREGYVEIEISKKLKPYLIGLNKDFTSLQLRHAVALSSFYAIRLYEILKQYASIGMRKCTVDELREYFGIDDTKYKQYTDFRKKAIDIAVREINGKTDIFVSYEEKKDVRRVGSLLFTIRKKTAAEEAIAEATPDDGERAKLMRRLVELGMPETEAIRMLDTYAEDPERVPWHLDRLEREKKAGTIKKTPLAWIRWAVKDDLREQQTLFNPESRKISDALVREMEQVRGSMARLTTDENKAYRAEFEHELQAGKLGKFQQTQFGIKAWSSETTKRAWLKFMAGKLGVSCSVL